MFIERIDQRRCSMRTLCNLETGMFVTIKQIAPKSKYYSIILGNISRNELDSGMHLNYNALTDSEALQLYEEIKAGWVNGRQVRVFEG